jgi:hypothetical protein
MAALLCDLVNDNQRHKRLLAEAIEALELCLEESGLTFSTEQAAEKIIMRLKCG